MKILFPLLPFLLPAVARSDRSFRLSDYLDFPSSSYFRSPRHPLEPPAAHRVSSPRGGDYPRSPRHLLDNDEDGDEDEEDVVISTYPNVTTAVPPTRLVPQEQPEQAPAVVIPKFHLARWMALANICLFACRPDPDVGWPERIPRIVWECVVMWNLQRATRPNLPSVFYVWLAFLTASTGLVDLFVWAPLYGAFVNFQSCEGGWFQPKVCRLDPWKGYSRLLVAVQAVLGGLVYLHTALHAGHVVQQRRMEYQRKQMQQQLQQQQQAMMAMQNPRIPPPYHRYERLPYQVNEPQQQQRYKR